MSFEEWVAASQLAFPRLSPRNCRPTSPSDENYNCIAWAASDTERWWWPDPQFTYYWPSEVAREVTLNAFERAFALRGYDEISGPHAEPELEKVAIYVDSGGLPTHAARQTRDGWWASKLGQDIDVEHEFDALDGPFYGKVRLVLARRTRS